MTANDFYVAIQGVLDKARESGWSVRRVEETALDAIEEWLDDTVEDDE